MVFLISFPMSYLKKCVHAIVDSSVTKIHILFLSTKLLKVVLLACGEKHPKEHPKTHMRGPRGLILFLRTFICLHSPEAALF